MESFIENFGLAMVELNNEVPGHSNRGNQYHAGIGPYGENQIIDLVMKKISTNGNYPDFIVRPNISERLSLGLENYKGVNGGEATPDLVLNGNKIIEFKLARPINDNGVREDAWFKKCFEPCPESFSTFVDVEKLCLFKEKYDTENKFEKWVVVIGFERRDESLYKLDALFPSLFQFISEQIVGRKIMNFISKTFDLGERHPHHQILKLYGFKF